MIVSRQERLDAFGLLAGLVVVFAIDSRFPLGVATGMLDVPLLFVWQPSHRRRWLIPVAALSTALILLDVALGIGGAADRRAGVSQRHERPAIVPDRVGLVAVAVHHPDPRGRPHRGRLIGARYAGDRWAASSRICGTTT